MEKKSEAAPGVADARALVNMLRTPASHRYRRDSAGPIREQLTDSWNFPRGHWPAVWAPVGLRYHALHHLFPALPYHSLAEAHDLLMRGLPEDSPCRRTVADGLADALFDLWRSARGSA